MASIKKIALSVASGLLQDMGNGGHAIALRRWKSARY
jgi:hypothetical protein